MSDRIEQLEKFIQEDPGDPFNYYALALECAKSNEGKALGILKELVKNHKDYLPIYYQLGKLYERVGQKADALNVYSIGITIAQKQNDIKTLRELTAALQELVEE